MSGLHNLRSRAGNPRRRKRVGRGDGSNRGSYSGRGSKGQLQRGKVPLHFEGGQLPIIKRLPYMRGFTNRFRVSYTPVNLGALNVFKDGDEVTPGILHRRRIVRKPNSLIKLLGGGEIESKLSIRVHACSASAREKIESFGGTVKIIESAPPAESSS